jgi:hypothetical protein
MRPTTTKPPYAPKAKKPTTATSPNQRGGTPARTVATPIISNPRLVKTMPAMKPKPGSPNSHTSASLCGKIPEVAWPTNASAVPAKPTKNPALPNLP